jgi:hypothetical protein
MKKIFETVINRIIGNDISTTGLAGINITRQFRPAENGCHAIAGNLNAAFLILLSGKPHPRYFEAEHYFDKFESDKNWRSFIKFYKLGLKTIANEMSGNHKHPELENTLDESDNNFWKLFFPEGPGCINNESEIDKLRKKRIVNIDKLNETPLQNPAKELLMTSNILLGLPAENKNIDALEISKNIKDKVKEVIKEEQAYWYDHPIQMGVPPENNETVYGLKGLDNAVQFEKNRKNMGRDDKIDCLLSLSVTHKGLRGVAKQYIEEELEKVKPSGNLNVYIFSEVETERILDDVLIPAAEKYFPDADTRALRIVFGVDGEYGRHYSFLKAISAFWKVFKNKNLKGTFKIDLDQVFPQDVLVKETGMSAFEHFCSKLWGAKGTDSNGHKVELGMIAGALVNEKDIGKSLYTPDVKFPSNIPGGEAAVFFSGLPMAFSTAAELMTRYTEKGINGREKCIQRIHVTGGTNGILVDSLRKYRAFTPTFIGRAEDQAFLLSTLFKKEEYLRYFHCDGLIMRHDKEAFAGEAIKAAEMGRQIGDLIRILYFTYYAEALPWDSDKIKDAVDPFTGCFISKIPCTIVFLRLALSLADAFEKKTGEALNKAVLLQKTASKKLYVLINKLLESENPLKDEYHLEKSGWDLYYDILDAVENKINSKEDSVFINHLNAKACHIIAREG